MTRLPKVVWRSFAQQTKYAEVMKLKVGKLDVWNHDKTHKMPAEHLSGVADQWRGGSIGW